MRADAEVQAALAEVVAAWQASGGGGVVWDGAAAHRSAVVRELGVPTVVLPAYLLELNPVERVFLEGHRWVEGVVYGGDLEAKVAAVEAYLRALASDCARGASVSGLGLDCGGVGGA